MTEEQLKIIGNKVSEIFKGSKEVTKDRLIELVCSLAIPDRIDKFINGEEFSYSDFKQKILDYNDDVMRYFREKKYDLKNVNNFNFENDFAPSRNGYLYESFYSMEGKYIENILNEKMEKKFFGGEDLNDKEIEYFNKQPLSSFSKYSANVFNNIFNTKNDKGENEVKDLSVDTVNKSLNGFKVMNDKIKSLGIFDILFHLPSYFGLKSNIKNLKNSLVEKGLDAKLIETVEKNEATPKEASLAFLYDTDSKFKELVDEKKLSKEEAYRTLNNKVEEKDVEKTLNEKIVDNDDELKLERKDEPRKHEENIEKNQRFSQSTIALDNNLRNNEKIINLYEKGKEKNESEKYTQFSKASHLKGKNEALEKNNSKLKPNKNKVSDLDLQNPKVKKKFDKKLETIVENVNEIASNKIRKSTIVPKDNNLKTSAEKIMANKKILSSRISAINYVKIVNDEVNRISKEISLKTEKFITEKFQNDEAQNYLNEIDSKLENLSKKEKNNYFVAHQDEKQKYDKALETTIEYKQKLNEYNQEMLELHDAKHNKLNERISAIKSYNNLVGNSNIYGKGIEKFELTDNDKKQLQNKFDFSADKIDVFNEMLGNDLEETNYTPEQKLEIRNMIRDSYIETRKILDDKLETIKEDEMEDVEEEVINDRDKFLEKLSNDTAEVSTEKSQAKQNKKSHDLTIDSKIE